MTLEEFRAAVREATTRHIEEIEEAEAEYEAAIAQLTAEVATSNLPIEEVAQVLGEAQLRVRDVLEAKLVQDAS